MAKAVDSVEVAGPERSKISFRFVRRAWQPSGRRGPRDDAWDTAANLSTKMTAAQRSRALTRPFERSASWRAPPTEPR